MDYRVNEPWYVRKARLAQQRNPQKHPVQLEIGEPMKRYICVFEDGDSGDIVVECYWADNYEHAMEQCKDSNPPDISYRGTFRDSSDSRVMAADRTSTAASPSRPACIECVMAWLLYGDGAVCLYHQERVFWRGSSSSLTPGAGDATQGAKDAEPGTVSDSPPCLIESDPVEVLG